MPSFSIQDHKRGVIAQTRLLPIIRDFFKKDIKEIESKTATFDFECNDYFYELKTRTNTKDKYPTTLIGCNKLISSKPIILIFEFSDYLTYIEYDKELFDTFQTKKFDRNVKEQNKATYIYIPIEYLKIIENNI